MTDADIKLVGILVVNTQQVVVILKTELLVLVITLVTD